MIKENKIIDDKNNVKMEKREKRSKIRKSASIYAKLQQ